MTKRQAWFKSLPEHVIAGLARRGEEPGRTVHISHVTSSGPEYIYCRPVLIHHLYIKPTILRFSVNPYCSDYVLVEGFGLDEKFPTDSDLDEKGGENG